MDIGYMPSAADESLRAIHPIEQWASCADFDRQGIFARRALDLLPDREGVIFEATARGLRMLGQTEADLAGPVRLLREVFGAGLKLSPPHVRLAYADGWQQPIMGFRVTARAGCMARVRHSLEQRGAQIADVELGTAAGVIRGKAPLLDLMGYARTLRRLSDDSGHIALWLSHYEPLWSYASETMACYTE
jgi:hypothetical protein